MDVEKFWFHLLLRNFAVRLFTDGFAPKEHFLENLVKMELGANLSEVIDEMHCRTDSSSLRTDTWCHVQYFQKTKVRVWNWRMDNLKCKLISWLSIGVRFVASRSYSLFRDFHFFALLAINHSIPEYMKLLTSQTDRAHPQKGGW